MPFYDNVNYARCVDGLLLLLLTRVALHLNPQFKKWFTVTHFTFESFARNILCTIFISNLFVYLYILYKEFIFYLQRKVLCLAHYFAV